jgi:hypothetical protein
MRFWSPECATLMYSSGMPVGRLIWWTEWQAAVEQHALGGVNSHPATRKPRHHAVTAIRTAFSIIRNVTLNGIPYRYQTRYISNRFFGLGILKCFSNRTKLNSSVNTVYHFCLHQCSIWTFRNAGILFKSETRMYRQKNVTLSECSIIDKCRYEIREQKEVRYGVPAHFEYLFARQNWRTW